MLDSYVARVNELLDSQRVLFIGGVKLLDTASDGPLRTELRQSASDLVAVDTIAAKIGTATFRVLDATAGHDFFHRRGYVPNLVVLFGATDIEGLVVNQFPRRLKNGEESAADILHMYKWAPGRTVTGNQNLACGVGEAN